jgi:hypothetical protein
MELSEAARVLAAILVFSLITVESGGLYLTRLVRGATPATPFQVAFARAGHAHAGAITLVYLGGLSLATGLAALGIGLIRAA